MAPPFMVHKRERSSNTDDGIHRPLSTATRTKFGRTCDITQAERQVRRDRASDGQNPSDSARVPPISCVRLRLYGEGSHDLCGMGFNSLRSEYHA